MKTPAKLGLTLFLISAIFLSSFTLHYVQAYTPPYTTVKIGLYYGGSALPSANLQNVTGFGSGYEFGILNDQRQFMSIGASTTETKITMLRDRNMYYDSANNCYEPGTEGSVVVGCYHIQMNTRYGSYAEASVAAAAYPAGFVKYSSGVFYVCSGNYISAEAANAAIATAGFMDCSVTSGTSSTVTVVKTGTNTILFEFEYGNSYWLTVMPIPTNGAKCQTWFKKFRYYGCFQYARLNGGDLTVINCVDVEDYVKGVIYNEMVGNAPLEAYKAQAVCARNYAVANLNKHRSSGFDLCNSEDCQVYRGLNGTNDVTDAAVDQTAGIYMTYGGQVCIGYYSSSDGGATENSENVWKEAIPYLRGVVDPYETDIASIAPNYNWTVTYTPAEITARLKGKGYQIGNVVNMVVSQYTDTGNVYKVTVYDDTGGSLTFTKGESIRSALGVSSIRFTINGGSADSGTYVNPGGSFITGGLSAVFAVGQSGLPEHLGRDNVYAITGTGDVVPMGPDAPKTETPSSFVIKGTGRGHNVGMSQWGAYSMAKFHNMTYDQILRFYFTGVTIG